MLERELQELVLYRNEQLFTEQEAGKGLGWLLGAGFFPKLRQLEAAAATSPTP